MEKASPQTGLRRFSTRDFSRKKLSLIHFITRKMPARSDMFQPPHQGVEFLRVSRPSGEEFEPLPKRGVQRLVLSVRDRSCLFDQIFFGAQSYIFHVNSAHVFCVWNGKPNVRPGVTRAPPSGTKPGGRNEPTEPSGFVAQINIVPVWLFTDSVGCWAVKFALVLQLLTYLLFKFLLTRVQDVVSYPFA